MTLPGFGIARRAAKRAGIGTQGPYMGQDVIRHGQPSSAFLAANPMRTERFGSLTTA